MTSVKGLLKGLRQIAQIFEQQKEPEMQIGLPTDVKHVGHIGWDGPSATDPSWMSEFKSAPEMANPPSKNTGKHLDTDSAAKPKQKSRRKSSKGDSVLDSPTKRRSEGSKQSRRSSDSPRGQNRSNLGDDPSTFQDPAGIPTKSSRRKKSKAAEGSSKALKSKCGDSLPNTVSELGSKTNTGQGMKKKDIKLGSVVQTNEEERG